MDMDTTGATAWHKHVNDHHLTIVIFLAWEQIHQRVLPAGMNAVPAVGGDTNVQGSAVPNVLQPKAAEDKLVPKCSGVTD